MPYKCSGRRLNGGRRVDPGMYVIENVEVEQGVAAKFLEQLSPEGKILLRRTNNTETRRECLAHQRAVTTNVKEAGDDG